MPAEQEIGTVRATVQNGTMLAAAHVYTTRGEWSSVDVFLSVDPTLSIGPRFPQQVGAAISVQLWAITDSTRVLVATGRYGHLDSIGVHGGAVRSKSKHMISYRGGRARFELTYFINWPLVLLPPVKRLDFGLVASDAPTPGDPNAGLLCTGDVLDTRVGVLLGDHYMLPDTPDQAPGPNDASPLELVRVVAASAVPGLWLQVHGSTAPAAPYDRPVASFPVSIAGRGVFDMPRGFRFSGTGFGLLFSSTAATYTAVAAGDFGVEGWYR